MKHKIFILLGLLLFALVVNSFTTTKKKQSDEQLQFQNLQVLPQDTDMETLKSIMKSFNNALGVKCEFCHTLKEGSETELDFASDTNFHKEIARGMMKMTKEINENYFAKYPHNGMINQISCITCHNGNKEAFHYKKEVGQ